MCLVLLALNQSQRFPFVFCGNRDEFFARPSRDAHFWECDSGILAGQDLVGGGTWLGVTRSGRFATVTNFRQPGPERDDLITRGDLTKSFLLSDVGPESYLSQIHNTANNYSGFNLLVGNLRTLEKSLWYYSNRENRSKRLVSGLFGLSNHLLDSDWPKVSSGKADLKQVVGNLDNTPVDRVHDRIRSVMMDGNVAPDNELPDTGIGLEKERLLSSRFIYSANYGTRATTVITIDRHGELAFSEQNHSNEIQSKTVNMFHFSV